MEKWDDLQHKFLEYLLEGDTDDAVSMVRESISAGATPIHFFEACISPALKEIGQRFETLEIFLPEMIIAAEIVQQVNEEVLIPAIDAEKSVQSITAGRVLLATVEGDLHDIGKNMVDMMLQVNGYSVINMGIDVPAANIVKKAEEEKVDIIGLSALLTTTLPYMSDVISYLVSKGIRNKYRVIVGGAALTQEFADKIGADGYGRNAADAVTLCDNLMDVIKM